MRRDDRRRALRALLRICLTPWSTQISAVAGAVGPTAASSLPSERLFRASRPPSRPTALAAVGGFGSFAARDVVALGFWKDERLGVETGHLLGIRCRFGDLGIGLFGAHGDFSSPLETTPLASDPAARLLLRLRSSGSSSHDFENTNLACVHTCLGSLRPPREPEVHQTPEQRECGAEDGDGGEGWHLHYCPKRLPTFSKARCGDTGRSGAS
jgi:hypothetical protein